MSAETKKEQRERLVRMSRDDFDSNKADLSTVEQAAIAGVLADLKRIEELEATIRAAWDDYDDDIGDLLDDLRDIAAGKEK